MKNKFKERVYVSYMLICERNGQKLLSIWTNGFVLELLGLFAGTVIIFGEEVDS